MGNVLQKATDAKAELDGKKAQYKVDENKSEFMKLKDVIAETTGAPVLGPFICFAFHRVVALCAFIFFVYTIQEIAPTFYEKKSFATVEFQTVHPLPRANSPNPASLPSAPASWSDRSVVVVQVVTLPDVYMCLPSIVVAQFTLKDTSHKNEWDACKLAGTPAWDCEFTMITGAKVMGTYDMTGAPGLDPYLGGAVPPSGVALGGASFQVRSGFGTGTDARAEVPLYSMESFDLKTYKGVTNPPVAELSLGGAGYDCTQEYYDANTQTCKGYALASNTPWPLLLHLCPSACSSTDLGAPRST